MSAASLEAVSAGRGNFFLVERQSDVGALKRRLHFVSFRTAVIGRLYHYRAKHSEHAFVDAAIEPKLEERRVRLRRWVDVDRGPRIEACVEVVDGN